MIVRCKMVLFMKNKDYWKLRDSFYQCRNFEINNIWQKSVLLTAFFVIEFSIYAEIIPKLFDENIIENKQQILHEICSVIAIIGIVFSYIWIMMAKGSKAWFEVYEAAIGSVEREEKIEIPGKYRMGKIYNYNTKIDNDIFSNAAGSYSPSQLNIIVGRAFLIIWTLIFFVHLILGVKNIIDTADKNNCECLHLVIIVVIFIIWLIINITAMRNHWARSSFITNQN